MIFALVFMRLIRLLLSRDTRLICEILLENLAYSQQVAVFKHETPLPRLTNRDRAFWALLSGFHESWRDILHIVKPATVIAWRRSLFRNFWRAVSRAGRRKKPGRKPAPRDLREIIRRMARENPTWGAPRIHGELVMQGHRVSERTVARYMPPREPDPDRRQRWMTFLRNHMHEIAAMDFFTVPTASFRVLYCLFIIDHGRRKIMHFNITENPSAEWVKNQIRHTFDGEGPHRFMIHDGDKIFNRDVRDFLRMCGLRSVRTAFRSPWQNGTAERWVGSVRRDLLDHVVVLNERHLHRLLKEYVEYYNNWRTHLALGKDAPCSRTVRRRPSINARLVSIPVLGGLHHRYEWCAAG